MNFNTSDHPRVADGTFTDKPQSAPEAALEPASAFDTIAAAVLAQHPDAVDIRIPTDEYDNGYFFTNEFEVTLSGGVVLPVDVEGIEDSLTSLTYIESPGAGAKHFNLVPYRNGERQPIETLPEPTTDSGDWEADLTSQLAEAHPNLVSVELETEEFDNGFFWAEEASGVDADGNQVLVDLSSYADLLSDAAGDDELGRNSGVTLKLR